MRGLFNVFVGNFGAESSPIISELLSVLRLSVADAAEGVEGVARSTKDTLRSTEDEVQEGKRDDLGRTKPEVKEGEGGPASGDTRAQFENAMDTAKNVGSKTIGVGQQSKAKGSQIKGESQARASDAFDKVCVFPYFLARFKILICMS